MFKLNYMISMLFIDCDKAAYFSTKSQYEDLNFTDKIKFKTHLAICKPCRIFNSNNRVMSDNFANLEDIGLNGDTKILSEEKKKEINKKIKQKLSEKL